MNARQCPAQGTRQSGWTRAAAYTPNRFPWLSSKACQRGNLFATLTNGQDHRLVIPLFQPGAQLEAALEGDVFKGAAHHRVWMILQSILALHLNG
jgi:hypothetical protein